MSAVVVEGLHKYYGQLHALRDVSFTVPKGAFFGLLGPNGAGKSTLIKILAGLNFASQGNALINGHHVQHQYRAARQAIGVVPQEVVQDVFFSVRELLQIQAGLYGKNWRDENDWINELLETLGLQDKANANMRSLSGGMKRRVMIAQALVHKPSILVLDEPTAGVDVEMRELLWRFITRLHDDGRTVILTTHYLEEAQALCEHIGIIDHGKLIALDETKKLIHAHGERRAQIFIDEAHRELPANFQPYQQESGPNGFVLSIPESAMSVGRAITMLHQNALSIRDIQILEPRLEDVFRSLVKAKGGTS